MNRPPLPAPMPRPPAPRRLPGIVTGLLKVLVVGAVLYLVYGVIWPAVIADKEIDLTATPRTTSTTTYITPTPGPTHTPGPRFEATQQVIQEAEAALQLERASLDAEREAYRAEIERAQREAQERDEQADLDHKLEMYDLEHNARKEKLDLELQSLRAQATFQAELDASVISKTLSMATQEVIANQQRLTTEVNIAGASLIGWKLLPLVAAWLAMIVFIGAVIYNMAKRARGEDGIGQAWQEAKEAKARYEFALIQNQKDRDAALVGEFLASARKVAGDRSVKIPTATDMQVGGGWWQERKNILDEYGYFVTIRGGNNAGTFMKDGEGDIGELCDEFFMNGWFSPTSPARVAQIRHTLGMRASRNAEEYQNAS